MTYSSVNFMYRFCNRHSKKDIKHFHHHKNISSCYPFLITPSPHPYPCVASYRCVFLRTSCEWSHWVHNILRLASFIQHNVFEISMLLHVPKVCFFWSLSSILLFIPSIPTYPFYYICTQTKKRHWVVFNLGLLWIELL